MNPHKAAKENTRTLPRIKYKKAKLRNELQNILGKNKTEMERHTGKQKRPKNKTSMKQ